MLKWLSGEEGAPGSGAPGSPQGADGGGEAALAEVAERLAQTERLVAQLKEMIREKDAILRTKDDQLKAEKEASESKLSKLRLQNKAKVTSLTSQLEEVKKQQGGQTTPTHSKKGAAEGSEHASRGKIVLLKKKVEDLEQQLAQREEELVDKRRVMEAWRQRGEEMDAMLSERDRKLAEKEAYIVHLQTALAGDQPIAPPPQAAEDSGSLQELQLLVQSLTKKIGEAEERYSLLQEQSDSLKDLLATEQGQYSQKETMYKQNIQTFKDIILQKDNQLMEVSQMHEQELFKLAAKSDASADLDQLLKALKQKLHEKEEVLLGKTQVIDVLQGEVDSRDQHIKGLMERLHRMQVERESLEAKLEAEKHVMRAQLRDLMEKQQAEARRMSEQHQAQMALTQQDLLQQIEDLRRASAATPPANQQATGGEDRPVDTATIQRLTELEAQVKQKTEEAGKSEAKFLKMKAWSKSRIRQLEDELKKSQAKLQLWLESQLEELSLDLPQAGGAPPDLTALRSHITELEEERQESLWKLEQYEELKAKNDVLEAKLVVYEEQQRSLLADLEQVTKRAASQASESGSTDDTSQLLEWQVMVTEAVSARDQAREEKASMALRISHMEEEREALASRQQELEEELAQARGLAQHRAKKLESPAQRSLQEDFEFHGQPPFQEPGSASESTTPMEGENMGGWWPEYSTPDTDGLRSVVEELELERNQLQEQILGLEERCQDLEDRLQLQARIETLQNESERLQGQLATLRSQQSRDAEKHQILVTSLNEQLKGLSDTRECLESSLIEKENILARTTEKLELITSLRESLSEKEMQYKDVSDKLILTEHNLTEISKKCSGFEKQCSELKKEVVELTQKLGLLKEKAQKQEVTIETLQTDLDQTNDELDKLNNTHLEERAQLIHDLQSCEREIDGLKDILLDKEKEIATLSSNMLEYSEQITTLNQEIKLKEEDLVRVDCALSKAEREAKIIRDTQDSDHQGLNNKITELVEMLKDTETQLASAKAESESKVAEMKDLEKQAETDKKTIQDLKGEIQKHIASHRNHVTECETHISSVKEQMTFFTHKLQQEVEGLILQLEDKNTCKEKLEKQLNDKEQTYEKDLKAVKEDRIKLLAEVEKLNNDVQILSKQIDENSVQSQGQLETIVSLEDQLKAKGREVESERLKLGSDLQARDSELKSKSENTTKLKNLLKNAKIEKQQLQERLEGLAEELESQKHYGEQINEKLITALELNHNLESQVSCLMKENERLQLEETENKKVVLEFTIERESLQNKTSTLDTQHLENIKVIEGLQKDKEELSVRNNELKIILQQSKKSTSESLLEKTNECIYLNQLLREREEKVAQLQEQLQTMISQVEELQHTIEGRNQTFTDLKMEIESQQSQKVQIQEKLSLLQEQESSLKTGLVERDVMLKQKQEECNILLNEIAAMKSFISQLQAEAESLNGECSHLRQQIEKKDEHFKTLKTEGQKYKDELNKSNEIVKSVTSKLSAMEENVIKLESEKTQVKKVLDNYDTEYIKLKTELEQRQAEMVTFQSHIQALTEQNFQLRTAYEIREKELAQQIQIATDLDGRIKVALAENSNLIKKIENLSKDNYKLQKELENKIESVSELDTDRSSLQEKISGLEMQHSENRKIIEGLLINKEEVNIAVNELNKVIEQTKQSNAKSLMAKTTECNNLSKTLKEKEDHTALLKEQVDTLKIQVKELNLFKSEKEKSVSDQRAIMEVQQAQIMQLQDTLSLLQEQVSVLKSGLMEKDTMFQQKAEDCSSYQNEVILQKDFISKMQSEVGSLREECLKLNHQIEDKEQSLREITQDLEKHKDELNKRNESLNALSSELSLMNEHYSMTNADISNIKAKVEKLTAENGLLTHEVDQKTVEIVDLGESIQVLSEQNTTLKTELQKSCTEQSKLLDEISNLRTVVCDKENQVSNLTGVLDSVSLTKYNLSLTLQEKEQTLKQKEIFVQQLLAKSVEVEGQKSQQSEMITHLHNEVLTLQETITGIKSELSDSNAKHKELRNRITEQDIQLQQKVEENISLDTQVLELKESISKLKCQVDTLTSESNLLKDIMKVKEQFILETQSTTSAVSENLSSKLEDKNAECESIKEQLSHLQESVTKLNNTLQEKISEIESLKETLKEKEMVLLNQSKSIQDIQRKADEAELFKTQFIESTELVSQLQSQIQLFSSESVNLNQSVEENQSAFNNLQEKYADHLEELQAVRMQLAQKTEEVLSLSKLLNESNSILETVRGELSVMQEELRKTQEMNSSLLKQKEEAFTTHQENMSSLTVEIEKLKSQHLQVVAQMNGLTENLEQREMALHAINSQYTAQAKHTANLVSEIQKLEEQSKRLNEELSLSKEEHQKHLNAVSNEKTHLQQELNRLVAEKDELERRQDHQLRAAQEVLELQIQQQSSSMNELKEKMMSEKLNLQAEVSEKVEEITGLKVNILKIENILQDSEKEWLFVLDRETKDKNILVEQLKCIENEMKSKDSKVNALKQNLDNLQEKLAEAASAIRLGSDQLKAKELEASASRVQLEKILASVQEKDKENNVLQQSLQAMESEIQKLSNKMGTEKDLSVLSQNMTEKVAVLEKENVSSQVMMKQMQDNHQLEFDSLRHELDIVSVQLQDKDYTCKEGESLHEKFDQIIHLQEKVEQLHGELGTESEKLKEMGVIQSSLHNQLQAKDEQISCMNIQISQQKELVAGLSHQLKDKDVAVAHVMESASNERIKLSEEKSGLIAKLESMEHAHNSSVKRLEDMSKQLEERIVQYQMEIQASNSKNGHLMKDHDHLKDELGKLSKEKEAFKKKLQAALLVRKDLLKRIEQYESQKEQIANDGTEMSLLQARLHEIASQTQATTKKYEENILILEKKILEKDEKILHLEKEREHIQIEKHILETTLNEKEVHLSETLHGLSENTSLIKQLHSSISEKEVSFECDRHDMIQKIEKLKNDLKRSEDVLKDKFVSTTVAVDLENELAQLKQEKAMLQKKTQAALLARKETMKKSQENEKRLLQELSELKDDYKSLLEQHCQQTNKLNAVQLEFDHQAKQLEEVRKASLMNIDELETFRQLVEDRDKSVQDLKSSLAEKEIQEHIIQALQSELETVKSKLVNISIEMAKKHEDFVTLEHKSQTLNSELKMVENDLEKAHAKIKNQTEELEKCYKAIQMVEIKSLQEKQSLIDDNVVLQNKFSLSQAVLDELKHDLDACSHEREEKYNILMGEKSAILEQMDLMKLELETALDSVSQKASEIQQIQNALAETQQELDKAQIHCAEKESNKLHVELLQQEKEKAVRFVDQLRDEVTILNTQLRESEQHNEQLHQTNPGLHENTLEEDIDKVEVQSFHRCSEKLEAKPKERDDALLISQALVVEKEELIASLEQQLQRQIHLHESAMEKMRTEVSELQQRSREDCTKTNDDDNQSKTALLTRKLQAALISRKELLKENSTLREQLQALSVKHEQKEAEFIALELSGSTLKQQNVDLESFISKESKEKDRLIAEVECILNDNHNLSAACESLKQTIENITQQKQAFSCQLESLKDSQTEDFSEWKSKHSELKQEYESLLQAYENVSSEMDKMRQLLEVARRERQDSLRNVHQYEAQRESLEKRAKEIEEENVRLKDKMRKFAKTKQQKIEALEEENKKTRKELMGFEKKKCTDELTFKNKQLEVEVTSFKASLAELREKLTEVEAENAQLSEKLQEASSSLDRWNVESKSHENSMQLKLNEALNLNSSLTVQIESQNTELGAQQQIIELLQKEKQNLSARIEQIQNDHDLQLGEKDIVIKELQDIISKHSQETVSLNEKVRILEDDKSLLQEELENVQEISDKVKNENEYLETMILKNSERIDELTESIHVLQTQNAQLSSQLTTQKEKMAQVFQEKEQQQLRLLKEYEEKLKTVQMGNEGPKNVMNELQELLKEKHHEINRLQQDCIKYQEVILDLERSCKTSLSAYEHLKKEQNKGLEQISILEVKIKQLEVELTKHKYLLQEATEKIQRIHSEKDQLALEISDKKPEHGVTERTIALGNVRQQKNIHMEKQTILQQQMDELQHVTEQKTQIVAELRQQIDSKDLQISSLKREAETNAAKLSALSSTFQGADATKQWNDIFQKTLHDKDSQLLEQGFVIKRFLEDMRVKEKEFSELRVTKSRLERTLNEYSVAAVAQQRQSFVLSASNTELTETVESITIQLKELKAQIEQLKQDKILLNRQLADKEDFKSQMQLNLQQLKKINSDTDAQLLLLQSHSDELKADLEKQEAISVQLKMLVKNKNAEISSLLSSRDGQMSGYLQQLQANHRAEVAGYEDRLVSSHYEREKADKELRRLESKVRSLEIQVDKYIQEREHMQSKMESFRNSMISLQTERERLMSEYRILDAKNQFTSREREGSTDSTKGLKHEIRKLLHQMDDLNSENAMLRAQLVRYREDLNQVLSLKDNQLKVLLKKQQDMIKSLENQKASAEKQHRESLLELQNEEEASNTLKTETSKLKSQVAKLEADILNLRKEKAETNEGKVIADLQQAVATKAAECNNLQHKHFAQKILTDALKDKLQQLERETDRKLSEAEDKYNSELDAFEREVQLMRNERETADRRVTELARDLLQTEQLLSEAQGQGKDMKAQNESLGKAMAALQNDRDRLIEDFKVLRNRYDEELRETQAAMTKVEHSLQESTSELAVLDKERHILAHKTRALESKHTHSELSTLVEELSKDLSEKERELKRVTLDNDTYRKQVSAFSRSMASLQNDRDRLMDELMRTKKVVESRQGSGPGTVVSLSVDESNESHDDVFQNEGDGLKMRLKVVELQKALKEAQADRLQIENEVSSYQTELDELRSERSKLLSECRALKEKQQAADRTDGQSVKEAVALVGQSGWEEKIHHLQMERVQLHRDLQRCLYEIQQRDQHYQQLNTKMQQALEERDAVAAQLRAVSQTLRDTQNRCHWLESKVPGQAMQGSVYAEVAPGAPQEISSHDITIETNETSQLRDRLLEVEQSLAEERARREAAEEALGLAENREQSFGSSPSRASQRDFSIQLESEEEWEALILNPNQPLLTRKVKGGVLACRRWLRGRSLYCSKLLTTRARSRYIFLAYLVTLHVIVLMCLTGAL